MTVRVEGMDVMKKLPGPTRGFLGALYVGILLAQPALAGHVTTEGRRNLTCEGDSTSYRDCDQVPIQMAESTMDLDDLYHLVLATHERSEAVWRQQPGNSAALKPYLTELRKQVTALCAFPVTGKATAKPSPSRRSPATEAAVQVPSGPVRPSQAPSPEDEVQKRKEATLGKFLSGGPIDDSLESRSLEGVPSSWIDRTCSLAEEELAKIDRFLRVEPPDHDAVKNLLEQLRTILYRLNSPPPSTPPVTPKSARRHHQLRH